MLYARSVEAANRTVLNWFVEWWNRADVIGRGFCSSCSPFAQTRLDTKKNKGNAPDLNFGLLQQCK
eukprot:3869785-Amphidinium_carterae.1